MVYAKRQSLRAKRKSSKIDTHKSNLNKEDEDNDYHRKSSQTFTKRKAQARKLVDVDRKFKNLLIY